MENDVAGMGQGKGCCGDEAGMEIVF